jgi:hypothetical protein
MSHGLQPSTLGDGSAISLDVNGDIVPTTGYHTLRTFGGPLMESVRNIDATAFTPGQQLYLEASTIPESFIFDQGGVGNYQAPFYSTAVTIDAANANGVLLMLTNSGDWVVLAHDKTAYNSELTAGNAASDAATALYAGYAKEGWEVHSFLASDFDDLGPGFTQTLTPTGMVVSLGQMLIDAFVLIVTPFDESVPSAPPETSILFEVGTVAGATGDILPPMEAFTGAPLVGADVRVGATAAEKGAFLARMAVGAFDSPLTFVSSVGTPLQLTVTATTGGSGFLSAVDTGEIHIYLKKVTAFPAATPYVAP